MGGRQCAGQADGRSPTARAGRKIYLIDKPDAPQSTIVAAHLSLPYGQPEDLAIEPVMHNFGGIATSRLNRNLRLDKHWSYGTSARLTEVRGQRSFMTIAPVQTDKTIEAMREVAKEVKGVAGERPLVGDRVREHHAQHDLAPGRPFRDPGRARERGAGERQPEPAGGLLERLFAQPEGP